MSLINILVTVDGAALASQVADGSISAGSQGSPTGLGAWQSSDVYIAMISQHSFTVNDGGGSELSIQANAGDSIRWTMQTFDGNTDYTAYLYNGNFNPSGNITPLNYFNMKTSEYLPPGTDPTAAPALEHNFTYAVMGTVIQPGGQTQYTLSFVLVNNNNGQIIGYFTWDPFINVSN